MFHATSIIPPPTTIKELLTFRRPLRNALLKPSHTFRRPLRGGTRWGGTRWGGTRCSNRHVTHFPQIFAPGRYVPTNAVQLFHSVGSHVGSGLGGLRNLPLPFVTHTPCPCPSQSTKPALAESALSVLPHLLFEALVECRSEDVVIPSPTRRNTCSPSVPFCSVKKSSLPSSRR